MTWNYDKAQLIAEVNVLRDIHFLIGYADVPVEHHPEYNSIYERAKQKAAVITEQLFADIATAECELVRIDGTLMSYLSPLWWQLVDAAIAELFPSVTAS